MSAFQWMGRMSPVAILLPGLIDIHCHGEMGCDAMEVNAGAFEAVRR
jgi:N-acetylglucosamine-6-phosphate deacetylase